MAENKRRCLILANKDGFETSFSFNTARFILEHSNPNYKSRIIYLKADSWREHMRRLIINPDTDILFLATHGSFGENGELQELCERNGYQHTHSPATACRVLINKHITKLAYRGLGLRTPNWSYDSITYGDSLSHEIIRKPVAGGGKQGLRIVNQPKQDLQYLYEDFIGGQFETSVIVIGSLAPRALPVIMRQREKRKLGQLKLVDTALPAAILDYCQAAAEKVHNSLRCRGVTKTDFMIDTQGKPWIIETDAIPALDDRSATVLSANQAGLSKSQLVHKIMNDIWKS